MHPYIHAQKHPDKPAYVMAATGETVTYRQLDDQSNRIAQLFRAAGLRPGDHIALFLENHPRFFEICWGAQRSGLIYTAISSRLTAPEVEYIVADCGAKLFVTSRYLSDRAAELAPLLKGVARRYMVDGVIPGYESWEDAVAAQPATRIADETAGHDMLYSSGTTGRPKGVLPVVEPQPIDADNPLLQITSKLYGIDENTVYLSPAPLYHAAPLRFNMSVMRLGGTVIIMEHFDAEEYLRLVEKYRATHTQVVPTMFVRFLKLPEEVRRKYDVSSLKCAIHAAAPCPIPVKEQMIDWWGPILWEYYAGTEGNGLTLCNSAEWLAHKGTVGRAIIGKLKICDDEGNELPQGQPGTIYFAEGRPFEYHNDATKTAESRHPKGWSTLGDVGYVDADGFLHLTDRKAFMIISGGVNIYPQECENLLINHPKVMDCAVFGVPNPDFGEEVKAVVQPRHWADAGPALAEELIAYCKQQLSAIKCPRSIDFEPELPRHPTGKLYKRLLRDRYWQGRESKIM
ncbi:AMP-binding enzyme C-terminal domain-containing protein [Enhydrobacter aerosaccus]|uniref:AMP-binding enzyme C-terminal domain-containing protein n=1 Tax=Enhydrobacter aerosaccus TaxID=225324 RepID=A0A1T4S8N4_9HYPH|nr:AMP-binding protein [Enhydrobacter aerosaccus]SKA24527.1 AMP-binding enzyme C-terminal domain-containing protein [Enhydrobacter aerosaccus]